MVDLCEEATERRRGELEASAVMPGRAKPFENHAYCMIYHKQNGQFVELNGFRRYKFKKFKKFVQYKTAVNSKNREVNCLKTVLRV